MNIRVIVPMVWDSPLRNPLLVTLKDLGYTWSKGDALDSEQHNVQNMKYIAISVNEPYCYFSSKMEIADKPVSKCGYNYMVTKVDIPTILQTINYIKQYLNVTTDENKIQKFVEDHYELRELFTRL